MGAATAVLILVMGLLTWRSTDRFVNEAGVGEAPREVTRIGLAKLTQTPVGDLVAEEAMYFDPSPLFLPTEWNMDQNRLPARILIDPGQMFQDFTPRLLFKRDSLTLNLPEAAQTIHGPTDVVSGVEDLRRLNGFGDRDLRMHAMQRRGGYIEVVATESGRVVWQEPIKLSGLTSDMWRPLELAGVINAVDLVGDWTILSSTGAGELDQQIRDYVTNSLHLGQRLAPGFYRILVGP